MAGSTVPRHAAMIKGRISKRAGVVAILASIAALDMIRCFARCRAAVMTADAGALNLIVINLCDGGPVTRYVAGFTDITGGDVVAIFTRCCAAIMTGDTITGNAAVIKDRIGPAVYIVAILTGITARNMVGRFAGGNTAVVTGRA